jgi:hypothetical protein
MEETVFEYRIVVEVIATPTELGLTSKKNNYTIRGVCYHLMDVSNAKNYYESYVKLQEVLLNQVASNLPSLNRKTAVFEILRPIRSFIPDSVMYEGNNC